LTVTATITERELFVRIAGVTHFRADRREIIGYQSWEPRRDDRLFRIEVYVKHGAEILLEYSQRRHWLAVLKALDGVNLQDYGE
jgi:hypothetical protein